jgi:beta-lactamase superfamily II metal-dependent hydrolase
LEVPEELVVDEEFDPAVVLLRLELVMVAEVVCLWCVVVVVVVGDVVEDEEVVLVEELCKEILVVLETIEVEVELASTVVVVKTTVVVDLLCTLVDDVVIVEADEEAEVVLIDVGESEAVVIGAGESELVLDEVPEELYNTTELDKEEVDELVAVTLVDGELIGPVGSCC